MRKRTTHWVSLYLSHVEIGPMKTIQINLPEELEQKILALSSNEEAFIVEAVKEKIEKEKKEQLQKQLIEGYQSTFDEDLGITKDFEPSDFEHWQ